MLIATKSKCTHAVFSRNVPYSKTKAKEANPRNLSEGETFTIPASQHWSCHPNPHACRVEAQQLTQGIMSRGIRKYSKEGNVYDSRFTIIRSLSGKNPVKNLGKTDVSLGPPQFKSCSQTSLRASASLLCVILCERLESAFKGLQHLQWAVTPLLVQCIQCTHMFVSHPFSSPDWKCKAA